MVDTIKNSSNVDEAVHHHPQMEHFLNLNTVLHSLVDFIRPETYVATDELQTYNELKDKYLRESITKKKKSSLEIAGVQSIRSTSGIYRFLAHHHKANQPTINNKQKSTASISREELLKKLHDKMPHRQKQEENGVDHTAKRKRTKDKSEEEKKKKPRTITTKEWSATPINPQESKPTPPKTAIVPNQITFGRFDFKTEDSISESSKKKKGKKFETKQTKLKNTLKQIESEENEINRLKEENPEEGKEILRSKHWKTALAKAKGEKVRDNAQLLRKTIKKQDKLRQRSAKKWQKTKSETDKRMKEKQNKRQTNLQKRKDDKKAKIKKRLIKKGRLVS